MAVILAKLILSMVLMGSFLFCLKSTKLKAFIEKNFMKSLAISFLVFRMLPFIVIYLILNQPAQSDVEAFLIQANEALKLKIVYNDYESFYAPLFTYILALPIAVVNSGKSIVFFMILMEFLAVLGSYLYFQTSGHKEAKFYGVIYFLLPAPLVFTVLGGQEDIWLWLFISWGLFLSTKFNNYLFLGIFLVLAFISTKIVIVLFTIPLLLFHYRKKGLLVSMILLGLPCLAFFYYVFKQNIFMPLHESGSIYAPNIWTIILPFTAGSFPINHWAISFIGLSFGIILTITIFKIRNNVAFNGNNNIVLIWIVSYALMIVFSKKSLGNYLSIFMLPLLFTMNFSNFNKILLSIINIVGVVQPSLWFRLGMPLYESFNQPNLSLLEYLLELLFVFSLGTLVYKIYKSDNFQFTFA